MEVFLTCRAPASCNGPLGGALGDRRSRGAPRPPDTRGRALTEPALAVRLAPCPASSARRGAPPGGAFLGVGWGTQPWVGLAPATGAFTRHPPCLRRYQNRFVVGGAPPNNALQLRARRCVAHRMVDCFIEGSLAHKRNIGAAPASCKR
jgi:hypothetical protein